MWFIRNAQGEIIYLKPNKLMVVSRKEGHDIVLKEDTSISKLHASIIVRPKINFKENEPSSVVIVQDTGSKYGTFIINSDKQTRKLTPGDHTLNVTDKIKFGLQHHVFTPHYVPFITATSSLNAKESGELKNILDTLDGVIIDKWTEYCTHLTVSNVKLTAQVVQALAFGTQIVTLDYWRAVLQSVENNAKLPKVTNFIPSIEEGLINKESVSLKTNPERRILFKDLCFVSFSSAQCRFRDIIKCAGGTLKLFRKGQPDVNQLSSGNVIVLQFEDDSSQPLEVSLDSYCLIQKALHEKKRRLIPESEILLAILYCSIEKYCNPKFNFKKLIDVKKHRKNISLSTTVLAPDTQDILAHTSSKTPVIINETLTISEQMEKSGKNSKKENMLKQTNVKIMKESSQFRFASKKIFNKSTIGSEESSREGCLVIDEAGSGCDSDNDDRSVKRRDIINEFDEIMDESKVSKTADRSNNRRRFDLQTKLQTSDIRRKETVDNDETRFQSFSKKLGDDLVSNPSTSKNISWKKSRDSLSTNKIVEDEDNLPQITSKRKASCSFNETDQRKSVKRSASAEKNMFHFGNEGTKRKKTTRERDEGNDLFKFAPNQNAGTSRGEENMFEKELVKFKRAQNKRRRASSVSSNDASSAEEEKSQIKIEKPDSDSDSDDGHVPFMRIGKEDTSVDELCKSTTLPLLRTDVDLTMDDTIQSFKKFVKVYTLIPKERIKLNNLHVWQPENESVASKPYEEESTSSEDEDDDFKCFNKNPPTRMRTRK